MSHCSRKNQMRCVERTFLCPSSSSCFDRSKSYREASKIANGRANSPSPQKTRRRVLCSWNTKRRTRYVWVVYVPLKFVQTRWWCVFLFFLVGFFFRRVLGKNNRSLPCFLCASTHASQANEENLSHIPRFRRPLN